VYFADGQSTATIEIPIQGNDTSEPDRTMQLVLTSSSSGTTIDESHQTSDLTILDDDGPSVSIDPTLTSADLANGYTSYHFTVHRTGDLSQEAVVGYHLGAADEQTVDIGVLGSLEGMVTFAVGSDTETITFGGEFLLDLVNVRISLDPLDTSLLGENQITLPIDSANSYAELYHADAVTLYGGDVATGGSGDLLVGGDGNDVFYLTNSDPSGGGAIFVYALGGDDVVHLNMDEPINAMAALLYGGDGANSIDLIGNDYSIHLSSLGGSGTGLAVIDDGVAAKFAVFNNFQQIDFDGTGNTLSLDLSFLANQSTDTFTVDTEGNQLGSDIHQLLVNGSGTVTIDVSVELGWEQGADWTHDQHNYHVYNNAVDHAQLILDELLMVQNPVV
jgi:hypothetical protein